MQRWSLQAQAYRVLRPTRSWPAQECWPRAPRQRCRLSCHRLRMRRARSFRPPAPPTKLAFWRTPASVTMTVDVGSRAPRAQIAQTTDLQYGGQSQRDRRPLATAPRRSVRAAGSRRSGTGTRADRRSTGCRPRVGASRFSTIARCRPRRSRRSRVERSRDPGDIGGDTGGGADRRRSPHGGADRMAARERRAQCGHRHARTRGSVVARRGCDAHAERAARRCRCARSPCGDPWLAAYTRKRHLRRSRRVGVAPPGGPHRDSRSPSGDAERIGLAPHGRRGRGHTVPGVRGRRNRIAQRAPKPGRSGTRWRDRWDGTVHRGDRRAHRSHRVRRMKRGHRQTGQLEIEGLDAMLSAVAEVARAAGDVALSYFDQARRSALAVEIKSDGSPVTAADRAAESTAREWIERRFPADGIVGEELGVVRPTATRRWFIDPIDGTKSFVHGVPLWGTLIGVVEAEMVLAGAIYCAAASELVAAATGCGAWWNGARCSVSQETRLD